MLTRQRDDWAISNNEGFFYGFTQSSRAWYADICGPKGKEAEEIMVGLYHIEGGCRWEFGIRWIRLPEPTPRVEMFSDSWPAFSEIPWLFAALADRGSLTPEECCELLQSGGFTDRTEEERPFEQSVVNIADPTNALREILPYAENELASLLDCQRRDGGLEQEVAACEAKVGTARQVLGLAGSKAA